MAVLIGQDQIEQPAPAKRAARAEALDRREVVGLAAESMLVELLDRRVLPRLRLEPFERSTGAHDDPRRLVFEPRLVGHHLARLCRARLSFETLERLPPQPG